MHHHSNRWRRLALSGLFALGAMMAAPGALAQGAEEAPVTLMVFSAFSCPYCAEGRKMLDGLQAKYPGKLRVIFKHYPMGADAAAYLPHEAALAAGEQGKFQAMHDALFSKQGGSHDRAALGELARQLKLDMRRFNTALDQHAQLARLKDDIAEAGALKVSATPTFYIQGYKLEGLHKAEVFEQIIDHTLSKLAGVPGLPASGGAAAPQSRMK